MRVIKYKFFILSGGGLRENFEPEIYLSESAYASLVELANAKKPTRTPEELLKGIIANARRETTDFESDMVALARRHAHIYIPILYADHSNNTNLEVVAEGKVNTYTVPNFSRDFSQDLTFISSFENINLPDNDANVLRKVLETKIKKVVESSEISRIVSELKEKQEKINLTHYAVHQVSSVNEEVKTTTKIPTEADSLFPEFSTKLEQLQKRRQFFTTKELLLTTRKAELISLLPKKLQEEFLPPKKKKDVNLEGVQDVQEQSNLPPILLTKVQELLRRTKSAENQLSTIIYEEFDKQRLEAELALNKQVRIYQENEKQISDAKNKLAEVIQLSAQAYFDEQLKRLEVPHKENTEKLKLKKIDESQRLKEQKALDEAFAKEKEKLIESLKVYSGLITYNNKTSQITTIKELQQIFAGLSIDEISAKLTNLKDGILKNIDNETFGKSLYQLKLIDELRSHKDLPFTLDVAKKTFTWDKKIRTPKDVLQTSNEALSRVETSYEPQAPAYTDLTVFNNLDGIFQSNLSHYQALQEQFRQAEEKETKLRMDALQAGYNQYEDSYKKNENLGLTKNGHKINPKTLGKTGLNEEETLVKELYDLKIKYRKEFNALVKGSLASNLKQNKIYAFVYNADGEINISQLTTLEDKVTNMKLEDAEGLEQQGLELAQNFQNEVDLAQQRYREALQKKAREAYPKEDQQNFAKAIEFVEAMLQNVASDIMEVKHDADTDTMDYRKQLIEIRSELEGLKTSYESLSNLKKQMESNDLTPKEYQVNLKKLQEKKQEVSQKLTLTKLEGALNKYATQRKQRSKIIGEVKRRQRVPVRPSITEEELNLLTLNAGKPVAKQGLLRRFWNWAKENPFKAGLIIGLVGGLVLAGAGAAIFFSGGLAAIPLGGAVAAFLAPYTAYLAAHITVIGAAAVTMAATAVAGGIVGGVVAKVGQGIKRFGSWAMKKIRGSKKDRDLEGGEPEEQEGLLRNDSLDNERVERERESLNASFDNATSPTQQIEEDKTIESLNDKLNDITFAWNIVGEPTSHVLDMPVSSTLNEEAQDTVRIPQSRIYTRENNLTYFHNPELHLAKSLFIELNREAKFEEGSGSRFDESQYAAYLKELNDNHTQYKDLGAALVKVIHNTTDFDWAKWGNLHVKYPNLFKAFKSAVVQPSSTPALTQKNNDDQ